MLPEGLGLWLALAGCELALETALDCGLTAAGEGPGAEGCLEGVEDLGAIVLVEGGASGVVRYRGGDGKRVVVFNGYGLALDASGQLSEEARMRKERKVPRGDEVRERGQHRMPRTSASNETTCSRIQK